MGSTRGMPIIGSGVLGVALKFMVLRGRLMMGGAGGPKNKLRPHGSFVRSILTRIFLCAWHVLVCLVYQELVIT